MREHIILCLERGEFSKFPQETICRTPGLKYKIIQISCNCSCNFPDWVYKMIGNFGICFSSISADNILLPFHCTSNLDENAILSVTQ
jgi:hypothetical protein